MICLGLFQLFIPIEWALAPLFLPPNPIDKKHHLKVDVIWNGPLQNIYSVRWGSNANSKNYHLSLTEKARYLTQNSSFYIEVAMRANVVRPRGKEPSEKE